MKTFESGVSFYTKGHARIEVAFPEDEIKCQYCMFCRTEKDLNRFWCRLTNEMIYNPFSYHLGEQCPIKFNEEE